MIRRLGPLLCALALVLVLAPGRAGAEGGSLRLENGADVTWSLSDVAVQPALGIALPAVIGWQDQSIESAVRIDLSTNYAAFIERWELALYRQSDTRRRHPLRRWRGAAAAFDGGVTWDGTVESGPLLRPGEAVVALLRVRDVAGNIDEAQPQTMQVSRYLMPKQTEKYAQITRARRAAVALGAPPEVQTIPVSGRFLTVDVAAGGVSAPFYLAGMPMDEAGAGRWTLAQIVPAGDYRMRVQSERPLMRGTRLVTVGRIPVSVPRGADLFVRVKGTGDLDRVGAATDAAGLTGDGLIDGSDAVRLTLWSPEDPDGRLAVALANPVAPGALYRDDRGRSVVRIRPALTDIPWGAKEDPRLPADPVKMRARYEGDKFTLLTLPHTDINPERVFVSLRAAEVSPVYLNRDEHFDVDALQGRVYLTAKGRLFIDLHRQKTEQPVSIEAAYTVRPSIAGMATHRPTGPVFIMSGDGSGAAGEADDGGGWFSWLLGG